MAWWKAGLVPLGSIVDACLPRAVCADPELERRARIAVPTGFVMSLVFMGLGLSHAFSGSPTEAALNFGLAVACGASPGVLHLTGRFDLALHLTLGSITLGLFAVAVLARGGGINTVTMALIAVPLFAILLGGRGVGRVWACASLLANFAIAVLAMRGAIEDRAPPTHRLLDDHITLLLLTLAVFAVGGLYELRTQQALQRVKNLERLRRAAERKQYEAMSRAKLAQSERLASMGRLAAALAHEINNPLTVVMGMAEHGLEHCGEDGRHDPLRSPLEEILRASDRIRRIIREIRGFVRVNADADNTQCELADAVDSAISLVRPMVRPRAQLVLELSSPLPPPQIDETQLVSVLVNLIVNASDAIPEGSADAHAIVVRAWQERGRVVIEVEDSGSGIPPEVIGSIMDPFFTTKAAGDGMGLGLSLCHGIVTHAGGRIDVESQPGCTVFRVDLPVASAPAVAERKSAAPMPTGPQTPLDILVVDDEPNVAETLRLMCAPHRVTVVHSGRAALRHVERGHPIDLILCDVMMPDIAGAEVYARLSAQDQHLAERILFISGGGFTPKSEQLRNALPHRFLEKPLRRDDLHAAIEGARPRDTSDLRSASDQPA